MAAVLIGAINNGGIDGIDGVVQSVMGQMGASTPLIGSALSGAQQGFRPSLQIMDTGYNAGRIMYKLANGEEVTHEEYVDLVIDDIAPFAGMPVVAGKRVIKAVKEKDPTEILGIRKKERKGRL
jgi:hypothetical protein